METSLRFLLGPLGPLAPLALAAACLGDAPAQPTWQDDVKPILMAQCARCHGETPIYGAPPTFRLDVPFGSVGPDGASRLGAVTMAPMIAERAGVLGQMPPDGPELNPYQRDVLINWAKNLCETQPCIGTRPDTAPTISATAVEEGGDLVVRWDAADADGEAIWGTFYLGGVPLSAASVIHAGRGEARFSALSIPAGSYPLEAVLNAVDPSAPRVALGDVTIGTVDPVPTATLLSLVGGEILTDATEPAGLRLVFTVDGCQSFDGNPCVDDPAEDLTFDAYAVRGDETVALASGEPVTEGDTVDLAVDLARLAAGPGWRIRVVVSDGKATGTTEGRAFTVGHGTTTYTTADAKAFFDEYCEACHGDAENQPGGGSPILISTLFPPDGASMEDYRTYVLGSLGLIYPRVVEWQSMPPRSAESLVNVPQPTQAERAAFAEWVLAGAPL